MSLRVVEEMLAFRGIEVSHGTIQGQRMKPRWSYSKKILISVTVFSLENTDPGKR
jgi:hypothetical protein